MKHFYKISAFFVILCLAACNSNKPQTCQNTCPSGQKQNKDCSCYAPKKLPATESQQKEIFQYILNKNEQSLSKLIKDIVSTFPENGTNIIIAGKNGYNFKVTSSSNEAKRQNKQNNNNSKSN